MRYRIKRMVSKRKARDRLIFIVCVIIYFLCFALSDVYEDHAFPQWVYEAYKKLPK